MKLSDKRILVTGADGFIGSHLVESLVADGAHVRAMVLYNAFNSWGWLDSLDADVRDKLEVYAGDVRDYGSVQGAMRDIDVVFHLAALIGIPYSYDSPESYVATNVNGTLNILQAARGGGCERVLVTSTSEVYGTARYVPIDEKHVLQAQSPYSATKIGADRIAESFFRSFDLPVVTVRPFNTYGPRQSARAIIPTLITQLNSGAREIKMGATEPTRDFVFVNDTATAFKKIAEAGEAVIGREINVATGQEISMGDLATTLIGLINPEAKLVTDAKRMRPQGSEVERLLGCNQVLQQLTGWVPATTLEEGLRKTIEWFSVPENLTRYKAHAYNV